MALHQASIASGKLNDKPVMFHTAKTNRGVWIRVALFVDGSTVTHTKAVGSNAWEESETQNRYAKSNINRIEELVK